VHTEFWWGNLKAGGHFKDLCVDGRIILKWIFQKWEGNYELHLSGSGQGHVVGSCECGNKPSGSIKCGKFFE
jgi:hypothetical protein